MFVNFNKTFHPSEEDIRKENEFISREIKRMHEKYGDCCIFCKRCIGNGYSDFKQCTFDLDINSDKYDLYSHICDNFEFSDFYKKHMDENYIQEDTKITPKDIEEYMNKLDERFFNADFVDVMSMKRTVPSLPKGECVLMDKDKAFVSNKLTGEKLFSISAPDEGVSFKDTVNNQITFQGLNLCIKNDTDTYYCEIYDDYFMDKIRSLIQFYYECREDGCKVDIDYWEDWSNTDCEEF